MDVRTYKTKSIQEAIRQIKEDIGNDAVILSTKRLAGGKDGTAREGFEVVAADHAPAADAAISSYAGDTGDTGDLYTFSGKVAGKRPLAVGGDSAAESSMFDLRDDLLSIKDMLFLLSRSGGMSDLICMHRDFLNLYARLIKSGLSERLAQRFINQGIADSDIHKIDPEKITRNVFRHIARAFTVSDPFENAGDGKRAISAFIGPTGVGKTTTVAKLAAELCFNQKKSVGLISIDSYRIGAFQQLKTYASIMGVPCMSAFSKKDVKNAAAKLKDKAVILIDTAGQSHLDKKRMAELGALIDGSVPVTKHLVLSAATRDADMKEACDRFSTLSPKSFVFSKLDETCRPGGIIDRMVDSGMPVSFISNGQRVPEDIISATKKNVLRMIIDSI
ncbi:MAG: flagellar biosynthesis protein FlhF [Thermodesulfobacteriota bacterium]|nr:flagellar biosynthesis protein FlhF [Thermodesulfobacteriota bacterium]